MANCRSVLVPMRVLRSGKDRELRYIVDDARPCRRLQVSQSFVVHLPDDTWPSRYRHYLKLRGAECAPAYMPQWDYEELDTVRRKLHPGITEGQVCLVFISELLALVLTLVVM